MKPLVLASGSTARRRLLAQAGLAFEVVRPAVEEVLVPRVPPEEVAVMLALAKAHEVSARRPDAIVIGADQVLVMPDGSSAQKPPHRGAARQQLKAMLGRTHQLISAVAVVTVSSEHVLVDSARLELRPLSPEELERCLDWNEWQGSAGSYQFESRGIHLIKHVDGDAFTIQGLPLLPLLAVLTRLGVSLP